MTNAMECGRHSIAQPAQTTHGQHHGSSGSKAALAVAVHPMQLFAQAIASLSQQLAPL